MRLSDENHHGYTRPTLMSAPRRIGGNDHIFAKLERDAPYTRTSRVARNARLAWLGGGGALILGLIGAVAWLVHDNSNTPQVVLVADTPPAASQAALAHTAPVPTTLAPAAPAPQRAGRQAATIYEEPEAPPARVARVQAPRERAAVKAVPAPPSRLHIAAKTAPALAPVLAAKPAAAAPRTLAARQAPARPAKVQMAAAARTELADADNDVALISAIIFHANNHAEERALQATECEPGKKCASKGSMRP